MDNFTGTDAGKTTICMGRSFTVPVSGGKFANSLSLALNTVAWADRTKP